RPLRGLFFVNSFSTLRYSYSSDGRLTARCSSRKRKSTYVTSNRNYTKGRCKVCNSLINRHCSNWTSNTVLTDDIGYRISDTQNRIITVNQPSITTIYSFVSGVVVVSCFQIHQFKCLSTNSEGSRFVGF